jgi:3-hydroxybutyryl-CoA dehydrogenase
MACSAAGLYVVLEDVMPSNLRRAESEYTDLSRRGGYGAIEFANTVEDAVRQADLAIDFVPDELESKLEIFSMIDRMAPPRTILCTPTEELSITDLASCVYRPSRCVGLRGDIAPGSTIGLVYPPSCEEDVLIQVEQMLFRIGIHSVRTPDPEASMLTAHRKPPFRL